MFSKAKSQIHIAGISPGSNYHKQGVAVIRGLLKKGYMDEDGFFASVGGCEIGDKLLDANVFAFHFNSNEVGFQSTLMSRYCEQSPWWKVTDKHEGQK